MDMLELLFMRLTFRDNAQLYRFDFHRLSHTYMLGLILYLFATTLTVLTREYKLNLFRCYGLSIFCYLQIKPLNLFFFSEI